MQDYKDTRDIEIEETTPLTGKTKEEFDFVLDVLKARTENIDTIDHIEELLINHPEIRDNPIYASFLKMEKGHIYFERKDWLRATAAYDTAAEIRPDWDKPWRWLAHTQIAQYRSQPGDCTALIDSALENITKAQDVLDAHDGDKTGISTDFNLLEHQGYCELQLGQYDKAIETLTACVDVDDEYVDNWRVLYFLGRAAYGKKDYPAAINYFTNSLNDNPTDHLTWAAKATALSDNANVGSDQAAENPETAESLLAIAQGIRGSALADFEQAINLARDQGDTEVAWYYCNYGLTLFEDGQKIPAFEAYNKAVAHEPTCAKTLVRRGSFRLLVPKKEGVEVTELVIKEARDDFMKAVDILATEENPIFDLPDDIVELKDRCRELVGLDRGDAG